MRDPSNFSVVVLALAGALAVATPIRSKSSRCFATISSAPSSTSPHTKQVQQSSSPLAPWTRAPSSRLAAVHVKLTYHSEQTGAVPTVVFGSSRRLPDLQAFVPFRIPTLDYTNDELPWIDNFSVHPEELLSMLRAVEAPSEQVREPTDFLTLTLVDTERDPVAGAVIAFDRVSAGKALQALIASADRADGTATRVLVSLKSQLR